MEVLVTGEIDASAKDLWELVRNFGEVGWMQGVSNVELEGEGVGMVRRIYAGGPTAVIEKMTSLDETAQRLGYTITENNPMPVSRYDAHMQVVDLGGGRSRLEWGCSADPEGVDEAAAKATVEGMYGVLISWVKAAAES